MSGVAVASAVVATAVAVDVGTTFAIVAAVGAVVGAVGVVANIPALKIAGGIIGAVGAVGGLASAAGVFGEGGLFGSAASGAQTIGSDATDVGTINANAGAPGALSPQAQALVDAGLDRGIQSAGISSSVAGGATSATPDIIGAAGGNVSLQPNGAPTAQQVEDAFNNPGSINTQSPTLAAATNTGPVTVEGRQEAVLASSGQAVPNSAAPSAPTSNAPAAPGTTTTNSILNGGTGTSVPATPSSAPITGVNSSGQVAGTASVLSPESLQASQNAVSNYGTVVQDLNAPVSGSAPNAFGSVWNFLKNNQTLVGMTVQGGAALIAGATDSLKPAQVKALEAQANANQAAANLSANQLANLNAPIPVARRTGLVNQAGA